MFSASKTNFCWQFHKNGCCFSISGLQGLISGPGLDFQPPELGSLCGAAQMMPDAARCCQMMPDAARCCRRIPDAAGCCQLGCCQMPPDAARCSQMLPDDPRCHRWSQMLPDAASPDAARCQMLADATNTNSNTNTNANTNERYKCQHQPQYQHQYQYKYQHITKNNTHTDLGCFQRIILKCLGVIKWINTGL